MSSVQRGFYIGVTEEPVLSIWSAASVLFVHKDETCVLLLQIVHELHAVAAGRDHAVPMCLKQYVCISSIGHNSIHTHYKGCTMMLDSVY